MVFFGIPTVTVLISVFLPEIQCHLSKMRPSIISHSGFSIDSSLRPTLAKSGDFQTSDTIAPIFVQAPSLSLTQSGSDQHFQWWESSPELVQSEWYGFNQFTPRTARHLGKTSSRKSRASFLMGESSQVQPLSTFRTHSRQPKQYDEDSAIQQVLRELHRNIRPLPQREQYYEPRIIMLEDHLGLPPGVLVPVARPSHQNNIPLHANYRRPRKDFKQLASAPTPVSIKVVPLKLTSMDIANALKSLSFVPISLDFMRNGDKDSTGNIQISYDDKSSSDDESELPRPSSHVATPLEKPLGITYADTQRVEQYIRHYQPRK